MLNMVWKSTEKSGKESWNGKCVGILCLGCIIVYSLSHWSDVCFNTAPVWPWAETHRSLSSALHYHPALPSPALPAIALPRPSGLPAASPCPCPAEETGPGYCPHLGITHKNIHHINMAQTGYFSYIRSSFCIFKFSPHPARLCTAL